MQIQVKLNYLRIAPRKTRQIVDLVRGKTAVQAESILEFVVRKPAEPILKLLKSAMATAKNDFKLDVNNLCISKIIANEGPKLKRFRPVSRGSAHALWKRTSHITLVLDEIKPTTGKKFKKEKNNLEMASKTVEGISTAKEDDLTKKSRHGGILPRAEKEENRRENKIHKGPGSLNRMFRRKSI